MIILQSTLLKILKSQLDALTIFTLVVFMSGWKEVKAVQYVARYAEFRLRLHGLNRSVNVEMAYEEVRQFVEVLTSTHSFSLITC
ncbi:hypothetical protein DKX38_000470 [Salix brachista]|uniref:Uncharacterized protein n=1 Tax=Salix brachista TaxID=2182728 RepID=A0A5N5P3E1_9ROSI|nr:hypothetical protein DKX38_000470 [Salix brachista]